MSSNSIEENLSILPWNQTRLALENLQELLKCNGCQQMPTSPQYMGRCDHFFCELCINGMSDNFCPICKIPSPPCDRKPDIIVRGLVSSVSEMFVLINGGEIKLKQGHEAPDTSNNMQDKTRNNAKCKNKEINSTCASNSNKSKLKQTSSKTNFSKLKEKQKQTSVSKNISSKPILFNAIKNKKDVAKELSKIQDQNEYFSTGTKVFETPTTPTNPSTSKTIKPLIQNLAILGVTPTTPAINKRNMKGETPLHIASIKKEKHTVSKLLQEGANPNTKDNAGWTPLHEACSHGFEDIATLLLEHGAIVDVSGSNNMTPLHDAVLTESLPVISLLRRWGASDTIRDIWGRTPRSLADQLKSSKELHAALDTPKDSLNSKSCHSPLQTKLVILDTSLSSDYKKKLESVAKLLKAKLVKEFSSDVTHIIVGCDESNNVCQRTIKYMMGVVSGKWILSHKWLDACLSLSGPANPLDFEVEGPRSNPRCLAPSKGRLNASKMLPNLFSGCHIYFNGAFGGHLPMKKELEALVKVGDSVPLYREPNPENIAENDQTVPYHANPEGSLSKCSHFCIYAEGFQEPQLKYDMEHIKSLPLSWLYECMDQWCIVCPLK